MPERGDGEAPRSAKRRRAGRRFRRPPSDVVQSVALRALRSSAPRYPSQRAFREAILPLLRRENPEYRLGGRRMRTLLIDLPGIRVSVRYAERPTRRPMTVCPVCAAPLRPIRNETLLGDRVVLGYRCTRCEYWTHLRRRVPVRYRFSRGTSLARRVPVGKKAT